MCCGTGRTRFILHMGYKYKSRNGQVSSFETVHAVFRSCCVQEAVLTRCREKLQREVSVLRVQLLIHAAHQLQMAHPTAELKNSIQTKLEASGEYDRCAAQPNERGRLSWSA